MAISGKTGFVGSKATAKEVMSKNPVDSKAYKRAESFLNEFKKNKEDKKPETKPQVDVQQPESSDGDNGISEPDYGSGGIEEAQQSVDDYGADFVGIAKGGLLKKKPKVKKMKRGGLASKK